MMSFFDNDRDREKNVNEDGEISEKDILVETVVHLIESISHELLNIQGALDESDATY